MSKPTSKTTNFYLDFETPQQTKIQRCVPFQYSLPKVSTFDGVNISHGKGLRVVERSWEPKGKVNLGTIVNMVKESEGKVIVQWDTSDGTLSSIMELSQLRLFGNTGVEHDNVACDECNTYPIRGLRWKCLDCDDDHNLCTLCYMADAHHLRHTFKRMKTNDFEGVETPPRHPLKYTGYAFACGILQNAKVSVRANHKENAKDKELTVCSVENGIEIHCRTDDNASSPYNILDLQCMVQSKIKIYPHHLPVLQKGDLFNHSDIEFSDAQTIEKVQFKIRDMSRVELEDSHKPVLYLIFDNPPEIDSKKDKCAFMDEVFEYSKNTKLPCHVVDQKVLFLHGSSDVVCFRQTTTTETIEDLKGKGCLIFERGVKHVQGKNLSDVDYFISMAKAILGEKVIPVLVPIQKSKINSDHSLFVPIVRFEKTRIIRLFTPKEHEKKKEQMEYCTTLQSPWITEKSEVAISNNSELISSIKDVESALDFEALICYVSIAVYMTSDKKGMEKELYADALSMYLLKNGKWRIPQNAFETSFKYHCIQYIYEKDLTTAFANGLHADLNKLNTSAHVSNHLNEQEIQEEVEKVDVIGLIFLALLRNRYYSGAIQLVDTGYVLISHILLGCEILQDASNDKKNEQIQRETSQRMKLYFSERATLITRFIYEPPIDDKDKTEFGEEVNHAGRLLLNHGYLESAIKTENKTFLENETVTVILNKMWYGEERSVRQDVCFFVLALIHLIVMPLLMINTKARPLKWFYQKYNLPFMKASIQMLGYLALLVAYSYMLLFNLNEEFSYTDGLILGWMISFWLNETKQAIVAALRQKFRRYISSGWNVLDWTLMLVYTTGICLKFGVNGISQDASKISLVVTFILLSIRILNMFSISEFLGPKLVIIQKMFKDTFVFLVILTVIMMSYNVTFYSLLYPNSELSWSEIEKVMQNGYWMLFGELNLDADTLTDCTFNKTIYASGALRRCPTALGLHISPYLKALYELIAVILLLNLLIAIYSDTYQKVNDECKFHWSQLQTNFLEEYSVQTIFPIHLQLLVLPVCLVHIIIWRISSSNCIRKICHMKLRRFNDVTDGDSPKDRAIEKWMEYPIFVQVFLYDANFDVRLDSTKEAERIGATRSKGKIDVTEKDKITKLQNQMDVMTRNLDEHHNNKDELIKLQNQMDVLNRTLEEHHNRNDEMLKLIHEQLLSIKKRKKIKSQRQEKFQDKEFQTEST